MKVRYTLAALTELDSILDYIGERSPTGAQRIKARLQAIERLLVDQPLSGTKTQLEWLRRKTASPYPYVIFYEASGTEIVIHAVRHAARDPKSMPGF